jgi:hypothetical protein
MTAAAAVAASTTFESEYHPNGHLESVKARARDLLTCPLCTKTYTDPRVLPCQHAFCRRCLQTHIDGVLAADASSRAAAAASRPPNSPSVARRRPVGSFACPACGAELGLPPTGASAFPVDERIKRIRELAIDEMARDISKRLGIGRVASAPDSDHVEKNGGESGSGVRHAMSGTGRQFASPSSRLGDIREFGGGGSSDYGKDFDEEDDQTWNSFATDDRYRAASSLYDRLGRRRPGYSSLRETRQWHRPTLETLYSSFSAADTNGNFKFKDDNTHSRDDPASTGNRTAANGCGDNDHAFDKSKSIHEQGRSFSHNEVRHPPTSPTTAASTVKQSSSTSSAFRNPYGDDDDEYVPIIGRHRTIQLPFTSSSLRERRRRTGFDPDHLFSGHSVDDEDNGMPPQQPSADDPETVDNWRRFYVASVGGEYDEFLQRRKHHHQQPQQMTTAAAATEDESRDAANVRSSKVVSAPEDSGGREDATVTNDSSQSPQPLDKNRLTGRHKTVSAGASDESGKSGHDTKDLSQSTTASRVDKELHQNDAETVGDMNSSRFRDSAQKTAATSVRPLTSKMQDIRTGTNTRLTVKCKIFEPELTRD